MHGFVKRQQRLLQKTVFMIPLFLLISLLLSNTTPFPLTSGQFRTEPYELRSGWYPREPYQMQITINEIATVTGFDIQVARQLFHEAGHRVSFEAMSWGDMLKGLQTGEIDFVMGSFLEERREFVRYSIPYRTEQNAVYYHKNQKEIAAINTIHDFKVLLTEKEYNLAIMESYAYGAEELEAFFHSPPPTLTLVPSQGYSDSLALLIQKQADLFFANPLVMDAMLVETGFDQEIQKLQLDTAPIPIHIMFSKQTISQEQVDRFNTIIGSMENRGIFRSLYIDYILPVYLSITTGQSWFILLNLLGILAFCTSGVLLARKERYNLFGALVLATLPAIGGGVLRDVLLGAERVFILREPLYLLVAAGVVLLAFIIFKLYDYFYTNIPDLARRIDGYTEHGLTGIFDHLFKFFDAWAVASFTIIGVSIAVEMKASPLWIWGPCMGVLTASGGVILRDIVRADFNIEMLKQDSYAEISLLGGILYTAVLLIFLNRVNPQFIFFLTISFILLLFGFRFWILWRGFANPLQFGALYTHPETRLQQFYEQEPLLWEHLIQYYHENSSGKATPVTDAELEGLHNTYLYTVAEHQELLHKVNAEPLNSKNVAQSLECRSRLNGITALEQELYTYIKQLPSLQGDTLGQATKLQQSIHESLKVLLDTTEQAVKSRDPLDFLMLENITSRHQERFNELRHRYHLEQFSQDDPYLTGVLHSTHKFERIVYIFRDYIDIRLDKKDYQDGNAVSRKGQQKNQLHQ